MALAIEGGFPQVNENTANASSWAVTISTAGASLIVACFQGKGGGSNFPLTSVAGGGLTWAKVASASTNRNFTSVGGEWWYAVSSGALSSQTITATAPGNAFSGYFCVYSITGANASPIGAGATTGTGTTATDVAITATGANNFVLVQSSDFASSSALTADSDNSPWDDTFTDGGNACYHGVGHHLTAGAGSVTVGSPTGGTDSICCALEIIDGVSNFVETGTVNAEASISVSEYFTGTTTSPGFPYDRTEEGTWGGSGLGATMLEAVAGIGQSVWWESIRVGESGTIAADASVSGTDVFTSGGGTAYTETGTVAADASVTGADALALVESGTVAAAASVAGADAAQWVETGTVAADASVTGSDAAQDAESGTVAAAASVTGAEAAQFVETGTVAADASVTATDTFSGGGTAYTETGTVAADASVTASDSLNLGETGTAAGAAAISWAEFFGAVETGTVDAVASVTGTDIFTGGGVAYAETGTVAAEASVSGTDSATFNEVETWPPTSAGRGNGWMRRMFGVSA